MKNESMKIKHQEMLGSTKNFLSNYLALRNRGAENNVYLSLYLSEENDNFPTPRSIRINQKMKEVELTLKSQLHPKKAQQMLDQFLKINPVEIVRETKKSIAFFVTADFSGHLLIPFPVVENAILANSLHLKPILSWITSGDQFYLITLSAKRCRLLKGDSFSLNEISSLNIEESDKNAKNKFISQVENEFYSYVKNDDLPIIVGGVNELYYIYKNQNRDKDLLSERIIGNVDRSNFEELHNECLEILNEKRFKKDQNLLVDYRELKPYGRVMEDLTEITIAAIQGRVRNLMIANDKFLWGSLDKTSGKISFHINKNLSIPEDDILDDLAEIVVARGGSVTLMKHSEMPSDSEAIAFLR